MAIRPRVLILSDSYLDQATRVDATRNSFARSMAEVSDKLVFLHTNSFSEIDYYEELESTLANLKPNFILSINASGLCDQVLQYSKSQAIPVLTWYWDHPALFSERQIFASKKTEIFHACVGYEEDEIVSGQGAWLPFSGAVPAPSTRPADGICFIGSLWRASNLLQAAALGLRPAESNDSDLITGDELYTRLLKEVHLRRSWISSVSTRPIPSGQILNALAGLKRARMLSWFSDMDLRIYGDYDWPVHLWQVAPELLSRYKYRIVQSATELRELMIDHRCSLNIFHPQNQHGGPNFRILDSASNYVPILSDLNNHCRELFPHGEAALYFENSSQARDHAERLLREPKLGARLAENAARLMADRHLHHHRIKKLFEDHGLLFEVGNSPCAVEARSASLVPDAFEDHSDVSTGRALAPKLEESHYYKIEYYYASIEETLRHLTASHQILRNQLKSPLGLFQFYWQGILRILSRKLARTK